MILSFNNKPLTVTFTFALTQLLIGGTAIGTPVPAHAQLVLEETVVTARKREETLMSAPVAVTAVSGQNMDSVGITNMDQLSASVPGLQLGRGLTTNLITIRGIGSGVNQGFEQSAGMYIDGVYLSRSQQFTQSLVDLNRVEVLRGPQGLLFGKNTIAGAIKVESASAQPGEDFEGSVTLDYEPEYETTRGTFVVSGSPTDTLGARLAVRYQESDGYIDNQIANEFSPASDDTVARLSLAWSPSDTFQLVGKLSYNDSEREGSGTVNRPFDPSVLNSVVAGTSASTPLDIIGTIAALAVPGYIESTNGDEWVSFQANATYGPDEMESSSSLASVAFNWDLGDYTLTGVTGFTDFEWRNYSDVDQHPGNVSHVDFREDLSTFSQELRIASDYDERFNFIAGLYYEEQDFTAQNAPTLVDGSLGGFIGQLEANVLAPAIPPGIPLSALGINSLWNSTVFTNLLGIPGVPPGVELTHISREANFEQETDTLALFAEFSFDLTDTLTLDAGIRYSEDSKDLLKQATLSSGFPTVRAVNSDGSATGALSPEATAVLQIAWGALTTFPHNQSLSRDEDHFDPMVRLRWTPTDDAMFYVSYTEGYKSGGFNVSPDSANPDGSPGPGTQFEDESAKAWEAGVRATLLDGRARVAATVFETEVKDLQVTTFSGLGFVVGNAAAQTSRGVELEGQILLTEQLELGGSLAYLNAEYDDFANGSCTPLLASGGCVSQDLTGQTTPFAPDLSGSLYAQYTQQVASNWEFLGRIELGYKDEFFTSGDLDPFTLQDSYTKVNARLAMSTLDGNLQLALYGRNLTDEATVSTSVQSPLSAGIIGSQIEEPRVYGLQLRYGF